MNKLEKIKKENIKEHIPIIMDDALEKIYETIGNQKLDSILEIGTAHGYSALCFSKMLSENGKIDTIEKSSENVIVAKKNIELMKMEDRINIIEGDAVDVLKTLNKKYDMIFIDAAKGKYPVFLEESLRLIKKGGIIFADNILYKGYVMSDYNKHKQRTAVTHLREYIKQVTENEKIDTKIFDVGDGLAISRVL